LTASVERGGTSHAYRWEHVREVLTAGAYTARRVLHFLDSGPSRRRRAHELLDALARRLQEGGAFRSGG